MILIVINKYVLVIKWLRFIGQVYSQQSAWLIKYMQVESYKIVEVQHWQYWCNYTLVNRYFEHGIPALLKKMTIDCMDLSMGMDIGILQTVSLSHNTCKQICTHVFCSQDTGYHFHATYLSKFEKSRDDIQTKIAFNTMAPGYKSTCAAIVAFHK